MEMLGEDDAVTRREVSPAETTRSGGTSLPSTVPARGRR